MSEAVPHDHPVDPARVATAREATPTAEDAAGVTELFRLLGDPVRTRILYALRAGGELCVGDLALALDVPEHSISYAVRLLRTGGVVERRREGRLIYYRLADGFPGELLALLHDRMRPGPDR